MGCALSVPCIARDEHQLDTGGHSPTSPAAGSHALSKDSRPASSGGEAPHALAAEISVQFDEGPGRSHHKTDGVQSSPLSSPLLMQRLPSMGCVADTVKAAVDFHQTSIKGLHSMLEPCEMLDDLVMDEMLGAGGYGMVLHGFWRSQTEVAVKIFTTRPKDQLDKLCLLPACHRALLEAILSRDLAHPHIIKSYDVRCCQLNQEFLEAVRVALPAGAGAHTAAAADIISSYTGRTPLHPDQSEPAGIARKESEDYDLLLSDDGFGALSAMSRRDAPISWHEILLRLGAQQGDLLSVIIMQHAAFGTLFQAIQDRIFFSKTNRPSDKRRSCRALIRTAREIALGLEHLHEYNVVHGDIKPGNVLLVDSRADPRGFSAALGDFGLAQVLVGSAQSSRMANGTASYMAPELLSKGVLSKAADIHAFGIVLYEMASGKSAFKDVHCSQRELVKRIVAGERPAWPQPVEGLMEQLSLLYSRCVHPDPAARPTASEAVYELASIEEEAHRQAVRESREEMRRSTESRRRSAVGLRTSTESMLYNSRASLDMGATVPAPASRRASMQNTEFKTAKSLPAEDAGSAREQQQAVPARAEEQMQPATLSCTQAASPGPAQLMPLVAQTQESAAAAPLEAPVSPVPRRQVQRGVSFPTRLPQQQQQLLQQQQQLVNLQALQQPARQLRQAVIQQQAVAAAMGAMHEGARFARVVLPAYQRVADS